jgi:hypothetical protein
MTEIFILQNQQNLFWGKAKEWVDGYDANAVFKTPHKDEAINQMVELSAKDFMQRIKMIAAEADEKGVPVIDPSIMPEPLPKQPKPAKSGEDLFGDKEQDTLMLSDEPTAESL